jgi:hypothetical protein
VADFFEAQVDAGRQPEHSHGCGCIRTQADRPNRARPTKRPFPESSADPIGP